MARKARYERTGETVGLGGFLAEERRRIEEGASPERLAQMRAAEESRKIYRAWNAVVAGTREGGHVCGLRYLPESNELLVYMDGPAWTQDMTLLREIIRARMEREGAAVDGIVFKTSRPGYTPARAAANARPRQPEKKPAPHADLSPEERERIGHEVAPIADEKLRQALERAMIASAEWIKGSEQQNDPK